MSIGHTGFHTPHSMPKRTSMYGGSGILQTMHTKVLRIEDITITQHHLDNHTGHDQ